MVNNATRALHAAVTRIEPEDASLAQAFHVPVLIVGAGACGLTTALRLGDHGIGCLVLERDALPQGSTALSSGFVPAPGTTVQRAAAVEDSPALFEQDIQRKSDGQSDPDLTHAYSRAIGPAIDWLAQRHRIPFELLDGFLYPGHSVQRMHAVPERTGEGLINRLARATELAGLDLLTSARVFELLTVAENNQDERLIGARFTRPDGSIETVTFDNLVLACNGYGGNRTLIERWLPSLGEASYAGHPGNDGSAVIWGEALGAELADMGAYQGHGAWAVPHGILISWALIMRGGIQLNRSGSRFHDETQGYSEAAVHVITQPGQTAWIVIRESELTFARQFPDFRAAEAAGAIRLAETTAQLAGLIGCEHDALLATLDEIRESAQASSADRFGRCFEQSLEQPFAAVQVTGALFHTQGGLATDGKMRVRRSDGQVIANCFAAGGAARGVSGRTVAGYLSGNGLLSAIAGAVLAADAIIETRSG